MKNPRYEIVFSNAVSLQERSTIVGMGNPNDCDSRNYCSSSPSTITPFEFKRTRKNFVLRVLFCEVVICILHFHAPYVCVRLGFRKMQYVFQIQEAENNVCQMTME